MTVEDLLHKLPGFAGWFVAVGVAIVAAIGKVLTAREAARPAATAQAGVMMESAFKHLRAEIDRQDAALRTLREDGHRVRGVLQQLEAAYGKLVRFTQDCIDALDDAGVARPPPPQGLTLDDLLRGPVTRKDDR